MSLVKYLHLNIRQGLHKTLAIPAAYSIKEKQVLKQRIFTCGL